MEKVSVVGVYLEQNGKVLMVQEKGQAWGSILSFLPASQVVHGGIALSSVVILVAGILLTKRNPRPVLVLVGFGLGLPLGAIPNVQPFLIAAAAAAVISVVLTALLLIVEEIRYLKRPTQNGSSES